MSEGDHDRAPERAQEKEETDCRHPFHCDPKNDIILISKEGTELRASGYHLGLASLFFEGLLSLPPAENDDEVSPVGGQNEPIQLDFSHATVSLFLDLASSHEPCLPPLEMHRAKELLALTEFTLSSEKLVSLAHEAVKDAFADHPFELLVLASDRNDVPMARQALGRISSSTLKCRMFHTSSTTLTPQDKDEFHAFLRSLNPSFRLSLLTIILTSGEVRETRHTSLRPGLFLNDDWSSLAKKFNPSI
ncbi:hypothetical protein I316_02031 [Kwoniella heveanensis BCC8398]|uniref:BTB domain-containing protein n=1 Tax=Kwoniella heveanensis BCC8398 TaxID=1296120 RepID=A0A1B9GYR0_9TREE|nr:hypothetical protein I316_02031 [Kwoniella heveanensis BCC8398]